MSEKNTTIEITSPEAIHSNAVHHGWYGGDGHDTNNRDFIPSKLALIHSEVSEALEAYREQNKEGFAEELADVVIRVFDLAGYQGIDIADAVKRKHEYNIMRPYKHGEKLI